MSVFFPERKTYNLYAVIEPSNLDYFPWKYTIYQGKNGNGSSDDRRLYSDTTQTLWGARSTARAYLRRARRRLRKVENLQQGSNRIVK